LPLLLERLPAVAEAGHAFEVESPLGCAEGEEKQASWKVSCVRNPEGEPMNYLLTVGLLSEAVPVVRPGGGFEPEPETLAEIGCRPSEPEPAEADAPNAIPVRLMNQDLDNGDQLRSARMETLALLAGGIAHDFKNVLTTVMANLSLVRQSMGDGELGEKIADAAKASESGCKMAEQLLSFARGEEKGERAEADVGRILKEAARLSTYGSKARCEVEVTEELWSAVINATQVNQVINNLLINARQAMGDVGTVQAKLGKMTLETEEVEGLPPGHYLRLDVIDHGCGIPAEKLADIFTPFFTTKETGNGLGLATCQTIMREHGGLIMVESAPGSGSTFSVFLPATGELVADEEDESDGEIFSGAGAVLVVDDQAPIRRVAKALLEELGYEVECAESGEEGVAKYRRRRSDGEAFGAVLMDMTLPGGIDGNEATEQILGIDPEARVVASSGYLQNELTEEQRGCGYIGVLSKPYDLERMSKALHEVLDTEVLLD